MKLLFAFVVLAALGCSAHIPHPTAQMRATYGAPSAGQVAQCRAYSSRRDTWTLVSQIAGGAGAAGGTVEGAITGSTALAEVGHVAAITGIVVAGLLSIIGVSITNVASSDYADNGCAAVLAPPTEH